MSASQLRLGPRRARDRSKVPGTGLEVEQPNLSEQISLATYGEGFASGPYSTERTRPPSTKMVVPVM